MTTEPESSKNNENLNPIIQHRKKLTLAEVLFKKIIRLVEFFGLICITIATLIASYSTGKEMVIQGGVNLGDLLLMFLYLEILAMVAIYLDSGKLPIRMPMYIAIVSLSRYLILEMKVLSEWQMIAIAVTITLITLSTLVLRYGNLKYPYNQNHNSIDTKD